MNIVPPRTVRMLGGSVLSNLPSGQDPGRLALGVRAEAARLDPAGTPALVAGLEYLGADTLLDTRIENEPFIVRLPGRAPLAAGDKVSVAWDAGAAHWFDATSGNRVT